MSTTVSPPLLTDLEDGILTLTLNRPAALNSLTPELLEALAAAIHEAGANADVRAVVLTGAGRGFCSGQDLKSRLDGEDGEIKVGSHLRSHYLPVVEGLRSLEKPVVAAVNGVAAGAGLSLALAADLRVASVSATFIQAFVRIGLVPDAGGTYYLPRLIGLGRATELAMLGDVVDATEALRLGLVNRMVADAELVTATRELASRLARGPRSIGLIKRVMQNSLDSDFQTQFGHEETAQLEAIASHDFREGIMAFLEKRPPDFTGR